MTPATSFRHKIADQTARRLARLLGYLTGPNRAAGVLEWLRDEIADAHGKLTEDGDQITLSLLGVEASSAEGLPAAVRDWIATVRAQAGVSA